MNSKKITIVDYGVGNLYSVMRAFEVCGAEDICITSDPAKVMAADKVVLPGVGAFADGMQGLKKCGLDKAICEFANSGRPLLGICLGMQLFATKSEEFGEHSGLGIIPGKVVAIPQEDLNGEALKIPFVGWSSLVQVNNSLWNESALASISALDSIFLVHSFHFAPENPLHVLAAYHYGGLMIVAAIKKQNITGVQFHPEKSGKVGLSILSNFINLESTGNIS